MIHKQTTQTPTQKRWTAGQVSHIYHFL